MEHYSDTYRLLKKLKDKDLAAELGEKLKAIENVVNQESFVDFIKGHRGAPESQDIMKMRHEYDTKQLSLVRKEIDAFSQIDSTGHHENDVQILADIRGILSNVKKIADENLADLSSSNPGLDFNNYTSLAKKYATDYIPFNQSRDPFQSTGFAGYCWGHSHRYAELASKGMLDKLSIASDAKLYNKFRKNFTAMDLVFRRVNLQLHAMKADEMQKEIWKTIKNLDDKQIFNFNFGTTAGAHSTSLRMVDGGIEYFDNNYGAVRFNNREDAANFLAEHLINMAEQENPYFQKNIDPVINLMSVYVIPQKNNPHHSIFDNLPESKIERTPQMNDIVCDDPQLTKTLVALFSHASKLRKSDRPIDQLKGAELSALAKELTSMPAEEIKKRVSGIIANKHHTLTANTGTGFHLLKTKGAFRSTTEELLTRVNQATMKACIRNMKSDTDNAAKESQDSAPRTSL